eukprot:COSAG04_NODE_3635_length_2655_cov_2.605634_4_plen_94_part_00
MGVQGEQIYEWDEGADGYRDLTAAAVAFAAGKAPAPMVTAESRAALRSVFAGYGAASALLACDTLAGEKASLTKALARTAAAETGVTQQVAQD